MPEPYSLGDFAAKVDWEGGIIDAIEWGLKPEDAPEEVRELWTQACALHAQLEPVAEKIGAILDAASRETD